MFLLSFSYGLPPKNNNANKVADMEEVTSINNG